MVVLFATLLLSVPVSRARADTVSTSPTPSPIASAASTPPSAASTGSRAPAATKITFSTVTANAKGADGRLTFTYDAIHPGTVIHDYFGVVNYSDVPATFDLGAADAYTTDSGSLSLLSDDQKSTDIGSWVTIPDKILVVPAKSQVTEPFTLSVPFNAKPGDHTGGMFAEAKVGAGNNGANGVAVDHRVAVPMFLQVPGKVVAGLAIGSLSTNYHNTANPVGSGSATVSYTVTNTGNVNLSGVQKIAITGPFGISLASIKGPELPELLPGKSFRVNLSVHGTFPLAWMTTKVAISPSETRANTGSLPPPTVAKVTKSAGFWATPILLLIIIVLLAAGVWGGRIYFRYRRDVRDDAILEAMENARLEKAGA